jgi:hypothetical protein
MNTYEVSMNYVDMCRSPAETPVAPEGVYGEFDAEGIPTKLANSEELSAKKRKDLVKDAAVTLCCTG